MTTEIVLASTSSSRRQMLEAAGVQFIIAAPEVDEESIRLAQITAGAAIPAIAGTLAEAKALAVSERHPHALVLGSDQILECDGEIFTKASDEAQARQTLLGLRGREHRLITAAAIARRGVIIWRDTDMAHLAMRDFSSAFLDAYMSAEMPDLLGSVGCYRIEGRGAQLFSHVTGDQFSIRGLPLMSVLEALRMQGALLS